MKCYVILWHERLARVVDPKLAHVKNVEFPSNTVARDQIAEDVENEK